MFLLSKKGMKGVHLFKRDACFTLRPSGWALIWGRSLIQGNAVFDLELQVWKEG